MDYGLVLAGAALGAALTLGVQRLQLYRHYLAWRQERVMAHIFNQPYPSFREYLAEWRRIYRLGHSSGSRDAQSNRDRASAAKP